MSDTTPLGDWGRKLRAMEATLDGRAGPKPAQTTADEATLARIVAGTLQLKPGYNRNSSSVGSLLTVLLWSATLTGVALTTMAALMGHRAQAGEIELVGRDAAGARAGADRPSAGAGQDDAAAADDAP